MKPCVLLGWGESKVNNSPGMEASLGARQIAVPRFVKTLGRLEPSDDFLMRISCFEISQPTTVPVQEFLDLTMSDHIISCHIATCKCIQLMKQCVSKRV